MAATRHLLATAGLAVLLALTGVGASTAGTAQSHRRITPKALDSVRVPTMCGHHAGQLVNGRLPGISAAHGFVALARAEGAKHQVAGGRLHHGGGYDLAAGFECNQGGVPWPEYIEVYGPAAHRVAGVDIGTVLSGEEAFIHELRVSDGLLQAELVGGQRADDPDCCGSLSAAVTFRISPHHTALKVLSKHVYTERPDARDLVSAINAGHRHEARRYASAAAVSSLPAGPMSLHSCFGLGSTYWTNAGINPPQDYTRFCTITRGSDHYRLDMKRTSWRAWTVGRVDVVSE